MVLILCVYYGVCVLLFAALRYEILQAYDFNVWEVNILQDIEMFVV